MSDERSIEDTSPGWAAGLNRAEASLCRVVGRRERSADQTASLLDGVAGHVRTKVKGAVSVLPDGRAERLPARSATAAGHLRTRRAQGGVAVSELRARGLFDAAQVPFDCVLAALFAGRTSTVERLGTFQLGRLASTLPEAKQRTLRDEVLAACTSLFEAGVAGAPPSGDEQLRLAEIFVAVCSDRIGRVQVEKASEDEGRKRVPAELGWSTLAGAAAGQYAERLERLASVLPERRASGLRRHVQMAGVTSRRGLEETHVRVIERYVQADDVWLGEDAEGGGDDGR